MASSMYHPRPVVSSNQRYPHAPDFIDTRRSFHAVATAVGGSSSNNNTVDGRPPLRESNGNSSQAPTATTPGTAGGFSGLVSCYQSPVAATATPTMLPPHAAHQGQPPQPPMVPSQSFDCLQRMPAGVARGMPHNPAVGAPRYHHQRKPRHAVNPLYFWPAFRQYRNRQAHKDTQKDKGGVWRRPELEDAFVDGKD
jgi:transcriptional enhancer factor